MSISGGASVGHPFQQSINGVRDVEGEVEQLPNRRKLAPINGARAESKLSELFTPISSREVHLEKLLTPPKLGQTLCLQMHFDDFYQIVQIL